MRAPLLILVGAIGCAHARTGDAVASSARDAELAPAACAVVASTGLIPGEVIRTERFSYCAPTSWRRTGAQSWNDGGFVRWRISNALPRILTSPPRRRRSQALAPLGFPNVQPLLEMIDERPAELYSSAVEGKRYTGARWETEQLTFEGEARDAASAALQLGVYRSVRFY